MTLRELPSVEVLAASPELAHLPHDVAVIAARAAIAEARTALLHGQSVSALTGAAVLAYAEPQPTIRRAINATGVLLHTNLGRATLAPTAAAAVASVAAGHATVETDALSGGRGDRQRACAELFQQLTVSEDALVVNNAAAATFLAIAGLASGREVVLSRGQMVEIGGHFRLPEVIEEAGGVLREVGTTNRTRLSDYARAIGENTGILLRCHPSNFKIIGFTEEVSLTELVGLGREHGVLVADDLGSGALVDLSAYGFGDEPQVQRALAAGADLVWFSGDKLLGGPQAGILLGSAAVIQQLKRHPLSRALRPDKLTLAGLEATLLLYKTGRAWSEVPILRRIARTPESVLEACERVVARLGGTVVATEAEIGGGSLPGKTLPSFAVALESADPVTLAQRLRLAPTPIYGRIERDRLLLDLRAVDSDEEEQLIVTVLSAR